MSEASLPWSSDADHAQRNERLFHEARRLHSISNSLRVMLDREREANTALQAELNDLNGISRRQAAEIESLQFRNEQLTKTVHALQAEVESLSRNAKPDKKDKKRDKQPAQDPELLQKIAVLEDEVRNKMAQNQKLVEQMDELERTHAAEITEVSAKFTAELRHHQDQIGSPLHVCCFEFAEKLRAIPPAPLPKSLSSQASLGSQAASETDSIASADAGGQTMPPKPEAFRMVCESASQCMQNIADLFHLYSERAQIYPYDANLEPVPHKITELGNRLKISSVCASNIAQALHALLLKPEFNLAVEMPLFVSFFRQLTEGFDQLIEGLNELQRAESRCTWSNTHIDMQADLFSCAFIDLGSFFEQFIVACEAGDWSTVLTLLKNAVSTAKQMQESFSSRWILEQRFPIASRRFKCVGEAIQQTLNALCTHSTQLSARLEAAIQQKGEYVEPKQDDKEELEEEYETPRSRRNSKPVNPFKPENVLETCEDEAQRAEIVSSMHGISAVQESKLRGEISRLQVELTLLRKKAETYKEAAEKAQQLQNEQTESANGAVPIIAPTKQQEPEFDFSLINVHERFYNGELQRIFEELQKAHHRLKFLHAENMALKSRTEIAEAKTRTLKTHSST